jgi:hypothetical protein
MSKQVKIPVLASELKAGNPLPWAVYDETGTLLLNEGVAPASDNQVASLLARGIYRTELAVATSDPQKPNTTKPNSAEVNTPSVAPAQPAPLLFEALSLKPGEILQIHSALEVAGDFMPAVLLGYFKNHTIIVTNPIVDGVLVPIKDGDPFNIKAFSGTNLFSFRTKVVKAYSTPYAHLHLEYPKLVHATKIRKTLRSTVNLLATLIDVHTQASIPVVIKDLSAGGARLILPNKLCGAGTEYELRFKVKLAEDLEEEVKAFVSVKTSEAITLKGVETPTLGVQFQDLSKEVRVLVMAMVYQQHA